MRTPASVQTLENLGRIRLSESFFMRDFLYSEISQIEGISNIPDNPELAIEAGTKLCETVLEPIQAKFGRISVRSGYRSSAVNARGAEKKYNCAINEKNHARHIWDVKDADGMGATACIVVNSFIPYYERTNDWSAMAWWVHDHIEGYSEMEFFPKLAAFNISWHEKPKKVISSYIPGSKRFLTRPDEPNFVGSHAQEYAEFLSEISK